MNPRIIAVLLATSALAATGGCSNCSKAKPARTVDAGPRARVPAVPAPQQRPKVLDGKLTPPAAGPRRVPLAIAPAEIAGLMPKAIAGVAVADLQAGPEGTQLRGSVCLPAADLTAAGEAVKVAFEGSGWSHLHMRPPGAVARAGVAGEHPPYRLSATVQGGSRPGCDEAAGQWFAALTIHKLGEPGAVAPPVKGAPAPTPPIENE